MISHEDMVWTAELMPDAAVREIVRRFRRLNANDIQRKTSSIDFVTEADLRADEFMAQAIKRRFHDVLVVCEEGCAQHPSVFEHLSHAPLAFVLDP